MLTTNDELLSGSSECAALAQLGLRTLSKFNLESTNRSVDILKNGLPLRRCILLSSGKK